MSKILLSSIGSRGDVQPILALALELKGLGHDATLCVPPDFKSWVESCDVACLPVGPPVKGFSMRTPSGKRMKFSRAQARQLVTGSVSTQFQVMSDAAKGADLIVVANPLQISGRSIAEVMKIPYVYTAYSSNTLPAWRHAPPRIRSQSLPRFVNALLWRLNDRRWNSLFLDLINEQRAKLGLAPIENMSPYVFTDRPWLAADAVLAPAASTRRTKIFQTGAYFLRDASPLPDALEKFLSNGEPPIYFGFGSMVSPGLTVETLLQAARKLRRRALISQGWANLDLSDTGQDCLSIGDVNFEKLLPRVAAIVHHGGAGTTTAAARAGKPQVIIPQMYDQFYLAHRVERLGIGTSIKKISKSAPDQLAEAIRSCLTSDTVSRAHALGPRIEQRGVTIAAEKLAAEFL